MISLLKFLSTAVDFCLFNANNIGFVLFYEDINMVLVSCSLQ